MIKKIKDIEKYLNAQYLEREQVIKGMLIAILARQHVLLVGSPGTAKSAIVSDLAKCITGTSYFQWLLTRFSTPEELFGPVSLKALEQDTFKRNTTNKLPEAHVSFVDEVFKANSAILNSLLTLANERLFYNNGGIVQSPLMSLIGASNEWIEEGEGLEALFDRFILRYEIEGIADGSNFLAMLKGSMPPNRPTITLQELEQLQYQTEMLVNIPDDVLVGLRDIRDTLKQEGIRPSDRRFRQSLSLLKASATMDNRNDVNRKDLSILVHSLWVTPERNERDIVRQVVEDLALDPNDKELADIKNAFNDILDNIGNSFTEFAKNTNAVVESNNKLKSLEQRISVLPVTSDITNLLNQMKVVKEKLMTAALGV